MFIVKTIIRTFILLILVSVGYFVFFLFPKLLVNSELSRASANLYPKYEYLSLVRSNQMQYIGLRSQSMQFYSDKDNFLKKIDEATSQLNDAISKPYKRGFLFLPPREVSTNLSYIQKQDDQLMSQVKDLLDRQNSQLDKIKKINSVLANLYVYDMEVDFSGLDVNSEADREIIIERADQAYQGLTKVANNINGLGDNFKDLSIHTKNMATNFSLLSKHAKNAQVNTYNDLFSKTVKDYEDLRKEAFMYEIDVFKQDSYLQVLAGEKEIILKYQTLLQKIDEMRTNSKI